MKEELTQEIVREFLHYDPDSGFFTWLPRSRNWFATDRSWKIWNVKHPGQTAGATAVRKNGYKSIYISILGKNYHAHRLAWLYMLGTPIPDEIDHEDQVGTNNRWANLKASSSAENTKNKSKYRNNKSGFTGVCLDKLKGKWRARCKIKGKYTHLGWHDTPEAADKAVRAFRDDNGFTKNHGKRTAHYTI